MSINELGRIGEQITRDLIKEYLKPKVLLQADWMFKKNNEWFMVEVKRQERYKSPPFDGHGLPPYQVEARLDFCKTFNITPVLIIIELPTNDVFIQRLDILDKTKYFTTGTNPRRIYNIKEFNHWKTYEDIKHIMAKYNIS